jgi:2-dehydro-3-deoxygalactonokinase
MTSADLPPADATPFCVAVDWGTTSFRLWVLDQAGRLLSESRSREGMMQAAEAGFEAVLRNAMARAEAPSGLPILICGMAGARQGWVEAPYAAVPAGVAQLTQQVAIVDTDLGIVRILPGVSQPDTAAPDVMRGEETQLLGLALERPSGRRLVCMPGTHSKWVEMNGATIERFATYMTGEMFDVLARHSILKHTLDLDIPPDPADPAFLAAASRALQDRGAVTGSLFALRAGQLLGFSGKPSGAAALSGLLIGAEVGAAMLRHVSDVEVTLVASGALADLYGAVLNEAGLTFVLADAEAATRRGLFEAARRLWA